MRAAPRKKSNADPIPLCVDLDGSLLLSDSLYELAFLALRVRPLALLSLFPLLLGSKARMKARLSTALTLDVSSLPYHAGVVEYLRREKTSGRYLVLATGADRSLAERVAEHLGLFDEVIASDGEVNLVGERKASALVRRFGEKGFDYVGNERKDVKVWEKSRRALVVGSPALVKRAKQSCTLGTIFPKQNPWAAGLKVLRPHQWTKNILLSLPMIMAWEKMTLATILNVALGTLVFSLAASAVYVLNDLLDIADDRVHPEKRHRPLASGALPLKTALGMIPALLLCIGLLCSRLPMSFSQIIIAYFVMNTLYSLRLKQLLIADVIILSSFYCLRLFAGSMVADIPISRWLLLFSLFSFSSLAFVKRLSELCLSRDSDYSSKPKSKLGSRAYFPIDVIPTVALAIAMACSSTVVFLFYVESPEVRVTYAHPEGLFLLFPLLLYWMSRTIMIAHRGELKHDPVVFALTDRSTRVVCACAGLVWLFAKGIIG